MQIGLTGQHSTFGAAMKVAAGLLLAGALAACTTVEGGNALTDFGTFEREVMSSTARGIGLIPGEAPKADIANARAPLVLPASGQGLPAPVAATSVAQLPANSDTVRIDTTNLTQADIQRLRNAKVVDLRSLAGRPLTEQEARALTARMQAANMAVTTTANRPLYVPPDEYFTRIGDANLVCSTPAGELVSINDPKCPEAVRRAIRANQTGPAVTSSTATPNATLSDSETKL